VKATHFKSPAEFRRWLAKHHATSPELWVGFYKKDSGKPSITWPESVDEALCYGWIDGLRRGVDETSYAIRFTPRKATSIWSAINIARAKELVRAGLMRPAGLKAFEARTANKSGIYSYEQPRDQLDEPYATTFKRNRAAWAFYQEQPASYRKAANWWVVSAKQEATRLKRLEKLIEHSTDHKRIPQFTRWPRPK